MTRMQQFANLCQIFKKSVESVRPAQLLGAGSNLQLKPVLDGHRLNIQIQGKPIDISRKHCHVVGFGKAVLGMAVELEKALEKRLESGILSVPLGTLERFAGIPDMQLHEKTKIKVFEGAANNQPDENAMRAAVEIKNFARTMGENDILFVLISGGGSALLPLPRDGLSLQSKMQLVRELSNKGASIDEMNVVRIALSQIKGGQLAAAAKNAFAVISFVISDIVGDPVDLIASGPTCAALTKRNSAQQILSKYNIWASLPADVQKILETPLIDAQPGRNNSIYVVGDNRVATATAVQEALNCGYNPFIASTMVQGEVQQLVAKYTKFLQSICDYRCKRITEADLRKQFPYDSRIYQHFLKTLVMCEKTNKSLLLILAGEPTVKITGSGLGGRNQELALRMSLELHKNMDFRNISFLAAGTDGIDGPTPAAGALGSALIIEEFLRSKSLSELHTLLENNDSYAFYKHLDEGKYHVVCGHTGTNVMDLQLILIA